jgi:predicted acyltransferase
MSPIQYPDTQNLPHKTRLLSLDVFRGITIAAMTLVNNPGDWGHIYPPLEHSKWDGCTPTDMIFPFFLFMVGVSIVYAMQTKKENVLNHDKLILQALRRTVILIVISLAVHLLYHPDFKHMRFPGVLQRIALVYFICTILYIKTPPGIRKWVLPSVLVGYYIIMCFLPVPDRTPANLNPETNMGAWLDRFVFGTNHLWSESKTWDPEGLLGTLPAVGTCLMGIIAGKWLKRKDRDNGTKVSWMLIYGILALIAGLAWNPFFPINKSLWTSSFVLYTGGAATIGLAMCYWFIDVLGYKKYTWLFAVFGVNAITAYILSGLLPHYIAKISFGHKSIYQLLFVPYFSPVNASLASAILSVVILWLVMWFFYARKIFIKI